MVKFMKNLKKISAAIIFSILLAMIPAIPVSAAKVGDVIGNVLNTDIKTYINGNRIPSYNINSKSAIFIKDLANYGFDTAYSDKTRSTTITYNSNKKVTPLKNFNETTGKVGTVAFGYVYTNIRAIINGRSVECFNVKGDNAIYFTELKDFGTFAWNSVKRESKFTTSSKTNTTATTSTTVKYYKDYPTVPDFGAFSGTKLTDTLKENSIEVFLYDTYDKNIIERYYNKLVKENGFVYYLSDENVLTGEKLDYYTNGNFAIAVSVIPYGTVAIIFELSNTLKMYADYPTIPDFGAFSNTKLVNTKSDYTGITYFYDTYSLNILTDYCDFLKKLGFDYWFTDDVGANTFFHNSKYIIAVGPSLYTDQTIIIIMEANKLSSSSDTTNLYYKDYPTVPDFGTIFDRKVVLSNYDNGVMAYVYDAYSYVQNDIGIYKSMLIEDGFKYAYTSNANSIVYKKGSTEVTIVEREDYIYVMLIKVSGITPTPTPTPIFKPSTNNNNTTSTTYAFPLHIYSYDGKTYLGKCVTDSYDSDSINNTYGKYGSKYQTNSIFNEYGDYGSKYKNTSAFNPSAKEPPKIVDNNGVFIAYLTENEKMTPRMTYIELDRLIRENKQ